MGIDRRIVSAFSVELMKLAEERMDAAKWKQTAIDLPVAIGASALGYGIGRTMSEVVGKRLAEESIRQGHKPKWLKYLPIGLAVASGLSTYATRMARQTLRDRREEASARAKTSGVEPAPQSRKVPHRKPSDPWRYDPRPAGWL